MQIEQKPDIEPKVSAFENQLYQKMEEVVDKLNKMEVRDLERENRRINHEKEKTAKRYSSSLKTIERIGKDLAEFKVGEWSIFS